MLLYNGGFQGTARFGDGNELSLKLSFMAVLVLSSVCGESTQLESIRLPSLNKVHGRGEEDERGCPLFKGANIFCRILEK